MISFIAVIPYSAAASMPDEKSANTKNDRYTVIPLSDNDIGKLSGPIILLSITDTIVQGETNLHYKQVSGTVTLLVVDLNWGNPSNSLRLTIHSPDNSVYGPYYDSYDGRLDGRILIGIQNPNGVAQGTWVYEVYGFSVTGTEDYYI